MVVEGVSVLALEPDGWNRRHAVILGHEAGKNKDSDFMQFFHRGLCESGWLSVVFNFPYMEQGRRMPDHQTKLRACFRSVVHQVRSRFEPRTTLIGGKSMGGRVASYIADDTEGVDGLIFLGYPLHPPGKQDRMRDAHLYESSTPMLFISGTRDPLAREDLLDDVVRRIGARARLVWIQGGDHSFQVRKSDAETLPTALAAILDWAGTL